MTELTHAIDRLSATVLSNIRLGLTNDLAKEEAIALFRAAAMWLPLTTYTDPDAVKVECGAPIGAFTNLWRQRRVTIYAHPESPAHVVTIGVTTSPRVTSTIITVEPRSLFAPYIGSFHKRYE